MDDRDRAQTRATLEAPSHHHIKIGAKKEKETGKRFSPAENDMINESLKRFFDGFHYDAHPMAMLIGVVGSLAASYHDDLDINTPEQRETVAHHIIAKLPTIATAAFKHTRGEPFIYPRHDLRYVANFLNMMFATPCADYNGEVAREVKIISIR